MKHAPPTSPNASPAPPTPEPLRVEWVSEGYESLDMHAWLNARNKLKAPVGRKRAMVLLVYYIIFAIGGLLCLLVGILMHKALVTVLAVFMLLFCAFGLLSVYRLLNPARFQATVIKIARKSDTIESTEGRWTCAIGSGVIQFEWLDRGHISSFPSQEITEVAVANDRVALLAGKFLRGFFPLSALPPGDPEQRVWAALRHTVSDSQTPRPPGAPDV